MGITFQRIRPSLLGWTCIVAADLSGRYEVLTSGPATCHGGAHPGLPALTDTLDTGVRSRLVSLSVSHCPAVTVSARVHCGVFTLERELRQLLFTCVCRHYGCI